MQNEESERKNGFLKILGGMFGQMYVSSGKKMSKSPNLGPIKYREKMRLFGQNHKMVMKSQS